MGKKWERFKHLDEDEYWREICAMTEERLRAEHKIIQTNVITAGAGAGASGAAAFFTFGLTLPIAAINARRINVNGRQLELIEKRLKQMEWDGHHFRKRDWVLGVGPCVAAELVIPAGGALLGQATQHAASHAAGHLATTAGQNALQASGQHVAQVATQQAAENIAKEAPGAAINAVATHTSTFAHAAIQGAQGEIFTVTHGAAGHAGAQYFSALPADLATAQAQILGAAAGQAAMVSGTQELAQKGAAMATEASIKGAMDANDKKKVTSITVTEIEMAPDNMEAVQELMWGPFNDYYRNLGHYERDGVLKSDIDDINTCTVDGCDCVDYRDKMEHLATKGDPYGCVCGHTWGNHKKGQEYSINFVVQACCKKWYPLLNHQRLNGSLKTDFLECELCDFAGCACWDYDKDWKGSLCMCGHEGSRHEKDNEAAVSETKMFAMMFAMYKVATRRAA